MVNIDKYRAMFGIPSTLRAMQHINYILILTRHYIYTCRVNSSNPNFLNWNKFLETEKTDSYKKNSTYDKMKTHWENGLTFSGSSTLGSRSLSSLMFWRVKSVYLLVICLQGYLWC